MTCPEPVACTSSAETAGYHKQPLFYGETTHQTKDQFTPRYIYPKLDERVPGPFSHLWPVQLPQTQKARGASRPVWLPHANHIMICRRGVIVVLNGLGLDVLGVGIGDDLVCYCMFRRGLQVMTGDQALIDGYVYSASMQTMREFAQEASASQPSRGAPDRLAEIESERVCGYHVCHG
jgi:hypothetical protein